MIKTCEELNQARVQAQLEIQSYACRILVCSGTGCIATGSHKIHERFEDLVKETPGIELVFSPCGGHDGETVVGVKKTGCQGFCELGPLVRIQKGDKVIQYVKVQPEDCAEIVEKSVLGDEVIERLLYKKGEKVYVQPDEIPFIAKQTRIVLENCGKFDAESLDEYLASGGFDALKKAMFAMTRDEVIDEVDRSGLRGRGGGGFPTGRKWKQVARQKETVRYVVCNGDEGDPGAFMDRSVLEGDPHCIIEAMAICGYATGASEGYIYVRAEYPIAVKRLEIAIGQAREYGLLGKNIFDSGFDFDLHIRLGAGAFVCGEETALMTSIEGNRGEPRPRPPYPAVKGLFGKPTTENNVETFANVAQIILNGADWFASMGTERSKGTKVFALGGKIKNTGLVEIPMGTTLREIVEEIGGGIPGGKKFKAAQTGGPSGGCIPAALMDTPIDYDNLTAIGCMMGSGGLIVMDEDDCMVDIAKFFLNFTVDESCGKCTPCRVGTKRLLEMLEKITSGNATLRDLDKLEELCHYIKANSLCGLGQTAPNPVLATLKFFRNEYVAHVVDKKCPAGVCKALLSYEILEDRCRGCTACARKCPVGAISGNVKEPHVINKSLCVKCGVCMQTCKFGAIVKR